MNSILRYKEMYFRIDVQITFRNDRSAIKLHRGYMQLL
jgi:hypothetical protein